MKIVVKINKNDFNQIEFYSQKSSCKSSKSQVNQVYKSSIFSISDNICLHEKKKGSKGKKYSVMTRRNFSIIDSTIDCISSVIIGSLVILFSIEECICFGRKPLNNYVTRRYFEAIDEEIKRNQERGIL